MEINYIIIQAGGKGSRMQSLTRNKPKALVPVENLPMIFHLFRKYPDKHFTIIGDYKYEVLEKYLASFADVNYQLVCASGKEGTIAGLNEAMGFVEEGAPFLLIWCDLVLSKDYELPDKEDNYIGISKDFPCRWSYRDGQFLEEKSSDQGVAGFFIFKDKSVLANLPDEGELVRWMRDQSLKFTEEPLYHTHEYGLKSEWDKLPKDKCRPFNTIELSGNYLVKRPLDEQGRKLAVREEAWYQKVSESDLAKEINIPRIYEYDPLKMEYIHGRNIYEYTDIPHDEKKIILEKIVNTLKKLHSIGGIPADKDSFYNAYIGKTKERLLKVKELVPFATDDYILINGRKCRNVFANWDLLEKEVEKFFPARFVFLHGDCTFSNMLLADDKTPVLIDPRGYFGTTEIYGDEAYDWVKLYYSLISNYDQFNLKRFSLDIRKDHVDLLIESSHWEDMEKDFFELVGDSISPKQMKLYLAIIWLSLTTYAWEDYDSICGAFYQGLLYFEEAMLMSEEGTGDKYFGNTIRILTNSLNCLDMNQFEKLIEDVQNTLHRGKKVIASGLGKNVPVCEKFVGTMLSLGLDANFMHTNTAVHGDIGMVKPGDLVILLSKSGSTAESVYLAELLLKREITLWLLTFEQDSKIEKMIGEKNCLVVPMEHEGDPWNIVPNNSTSLNLIILQGLAMSIATREHLSMERNFKPNHPGGAIGEKLRVSEK